MSLLSVKNLSLSYGKQSIFSDVSFSIEKNKITSIIGPSGCGKSSLLSCLNRMNEFEPEARLQGEISFLDQSIYNYELQELRQSIGMIYQKPTPLPFSIEKNFKIPLTEPGYKPCCPWQEAMEFCLRQVGLWDEVKDRLSTSALKLSGGQQQRLCIARTLSLEPKLLLFDEPTSSLDPISARVIEELILKLKESYTLVLVTHNLAQAKRVSDNCLFMWWIENQGELVEKTKASEFFNNPQSPFAQQYLKAERL